MQQVSQYLAGERDYTLLKGDTGPLVYPAAHVYIYSALSYLTDNGRNIRLAQILFWALYLEVLSVVMACYRLAKVRFSNPQYVRKSHGTFSPGAAVSFPPSGAIETPAQHLRPATIQ